MTSSDPHLQRFCALPDPYPEPKVAERSFYYASLLLQDYAGMVSEMTAINQYIYHHLTFEFTKDLSELAKLEECISIIEMYHLELLGETIYLLGIDPEFKILDKGRQIYWNASYVYYGEKVCDRLAADIEAERKAISQYKEHRQLIRDPHIQKLLERIILDEEYHLKLFMQAASQYCPAK